MAESNNLKKGNKSLSKFCSFENFKLILVPGKAQFEDVAGATFEKRQRSMVQKQSK